MEENIIDDILKGSQKAFKELIDTYQNQVHNTCFGFVGNNEDADDLAQDVFIEVYQSLYKFKQDASLSTWIYRITVNKSLDYIKKQKRIKRWGSIIKLSTETDVIKDRWIGHNETPDLNLEQKERIDILNAAIGKLPKNQRIAFTLNKYEELSYMEISKIMNNSISSVESLLHRAKNNLKITLENYYKNEFLNN